MSSFTGSSAEAQSSCENDGVSSFTRSSVEAQSSCEDDGVSQLCSIETQTDPECFHTTLGLKTVGTQTEDRSEVQKNLLTPSSRSLFVSIPIQHFMNMRVYSTIHLGKLLSSMKCIENWFLLSCESESSTLKLVKISDKSTMTQEITSDMHWCISLSRVCIACSAPQFSHVPAFITCLNDLQQVLKCLNQMKLCCGIADAQFAPVTAKCKGNFVDRAGKFLLYM